MTKNCVSLPEQTKSDLVPQPLSALIERLEKATGPDRELDLAIALAVCPNVLVAKRDTLTGALRDYTYWEYTASIDAALTLVPPEWMWALHGGKGSCLGAQLNLPDVETPEVEIFVDDAASVAIALCIAALKARRDDVEERT